MTRQPMHDWDRSDPETVQRTPSDNEAQNSQGPIAWHSEENLVMSDRGVGKLRRQYTRELKAMAEGKRLMCIRMPGDDPMFPVKAGAYIIKEAPKGATPVTSAPGTPTAKIAGNWAISMNTPMGAQTIPMAFSQDGIAFSGAMTSPEGDETAFTGGTVEGARILWAIELTKPMPMKVEFDLVVDGDSLIGTFKPGPFPATPATGVRSPSPIHQKGNP
ncbi:MAG: hypothetical protein RLY97_984 [Pseudomonadota bacterium]